MADEYLCFKDLSDDVVSAADAAEDVRFRNRRFVEADGARLETSQTDFVLALVRVDRHARKAPENERSALKYGLLTKPG